MINITIDPQIFAGAPGLVLGCVRAAVRTEPGSDALWAEMQCAAEETAADLAEPSARPPIAATRELYRRLGKDPSRYRGSPEALLRRARSGKELYRIHNVVDVINLVSLRTLLPIGLYDAETLRSPLVLRRGAPGEAYDGIGKEQLNLDGLPVLADAEGPFGSPTSDSRRTMVTERHGRGVRRRLRRHRPRRAGAGDGAARGAPPPPLRGRGGRNPFRVTRTQQLHFTQSRGVAERSPPAEGTQRERLPIDCHRPA